jgi:hypothetical protein
MRPHLKHPFLDMFMGFSTKASLWGYPHSGHQGAKKSAAFTMALTAPRAPTWDKQNVVDIYIYIHMCMCIYIYIDIDIDIDI